MRFCGSARRGVEEGVSKLAQPARISRSDAVSPTAGVENVPETQSGKNDRHARGIRSNCCSLLCGICIREIEWRASRHTLKGDAREPASVSGDKKSLVIDPGGYGRSRVPRV